MNDSLEEDSIKFDSFGSLIDYQEKKDGLLELFTKTVLKLFMIFRLFYFVLSFSEKFPLKDYSIQTKDGYILKLKRIPNPNSSKPPVFLQHGILNTSDIFLLGDHQNNLAYILSNAGYDVWLGNTRGNRYCRKHVSLSPEQKEFWNYNLQEIATIDIKSSLDFVLGETNKKDLHYIGHSQGTTVSLILLSEVPEYNSIIKSATLLAPVAFMGGLATRRRNMLDTLSYSVLAKALAGDAMRTRGSMELFPYNEKMADKMRELLVKYEKPCKEYYDAAGIVGKEHFNQVGFYLLF